MTDFWHFPLEIWMFATWIGIVTIARILWSVGRKQGKKDWLKYEELKKKYEDKK